MWLVPWLLLFVLTQPPQRAPPLIADDLPKGVCSGHAATSCGADGWLITPTATEPLLVSRDVCVRWHASRASDVWQPLPNAVIGAGVAKTMVVLVSGAVEVSVGDEVGVSGVAAKVHLLLVVSPRA